MARKHKKLKPRSAASLSPAAVLELKTEAPPAAPAELADRMRLELPARADALLAAENWEGLIELGRTNLDGFTENDRKWAAGWLPRIEVIGLTHCYEMSRYQIVDEHRQRLATLLSTMAKDVACFHRRPEFSAYLKHLNLNSLKSTLHAYQLLQAAFRDTPKFDWIARARTLAQRLIWCEVYYGMASNSLELSSADKALLATPGYASELMSTMYEQLQSCTDLTEQERLTLQVLQLDHAGEQAAPSEYAQVLDAMLQLPSPSQAELSQGTDGPRGQHLTPKGWAFLWSLNRARFEDCPALLERQPGPDDCDACAGLRFLVQSLFAPPSQTDALLAQGVRALMRYQDEAGERLGSFLTVCLSSGIETLQIEPIGLADVDVLETVRWLVECMPAGYARAEEFTGLCRILEALQAFDALDASVVPGFDWLCSQSLAVQMSAVVSAEHPANKSVLLLQGLCRCADEGYPYQHVDFELRDPGDDLDPAQAGLVLDLLERLALVRPRLDALSEQLWRKAADDIFRRLTNTKDGDKARTLALTRRFSQDLTGSMQWFRLGCLEQLAGSSDQSLDCYLKYLETDNAERSSTLANIKLLWAKNASTAEVLALVQRLEVALSAGPHQAELQNLFTDAQARLQTLEKCQQFERTAINRWPGLTPPARKLLGVLNVVQRYGSFEELGSYAGMDGVWAKRHHAKLVETGMLIVSGATYSVNSHIQPLLEREAQHEVVGRIVRAQGTSAVKQVFNSQREFLIYQVMVQLCPNHLVFPNSSLQSIMSYDRIKELVSDDDFGYYLRASVDLVLISSTTYLPWLAIEVDSVWHDTERQQKNDGKKDRLFAAAGVPFMRLQPVGNPSEATIRGQVAQHLDELVRTLRADLPGYEQARRLLADLAGAQTEQAAEVEEQG